MFSTIEVTTSQMVGENHDWKNAVMSYLDSPPTSTKWWLLFGCNVKFKSALKFYVVPKTVRK